jgi:hypothetical protein
VIIVPLPKRTIDLGNRAATPKNAAVTGIALAFLSWLVLLFAGFGGENAACPDGDAAWVDPLAVACAVTATLGMAAAVWAYRESAGTPSGEWLLGAAGLYVTSLGWTATVTGAVALLFVDVCSL